MAIRLLSTYLYQFTILHFSDLSLCIYGLKSINLRLARKKSQVDLKEIAANNLGI